MITTPPIVLPEELGGRIEDVYRPLDRSLLPELSNLLAWLEMHDPEVLAGVADVDRTLIQMMLEQTPLERLDNNCRFANDALELQAAYLLDQR